MFFICDFTVSGPMARFLAISLLDWPSAINLSISLSRGLRDSATADAEASCERRSKSALFCRHHLGDGECRSISGRPVQPVGPMVANDGWAGEPLSRPIAAEGGGRRPAFTVAASPAKLASRVDRLLAGIIRHAIVLDEVSACGTLNLCPI